MTRVPTSHARRPRIPARLRLAGLRDRRLASPPTVTEASRITRTQESTAEVQAPLDLRCVRHLPAYGFRLAGSVNYKTGRYARIVEADFALPGYELRDLVGDLPDPEPVAALAPRKRRSSEHDDPYKRISPPEYFEKLAGIDVPRGGLVRCPAHDDRHPSCSVGIDSTQGWKCHSASCGAGGAIYDLASVLLGGPYGRELRGEAFLRAKAYVADVFGELT